MSLSNDEKQKFIESISVFVMKYAPMYDIRVNSPIIAQAILESGFGNSKLSKNYHNYFGLKCGSKWTGRSVNFKTKEEYTAGVISIIKDNFRVYSSIESGVKGYFQFLFDRSSGRYRNLKGVSDPEQYLRNLSVDGYATDKAYVERCMRIIRNYNLTEYDRPAAGWEKSADGWRYRLNGSFIRNKWKRIKGRWYVFNDVGLMVTGWFKSGDSWFYLNPDDGSMVSDQWLSYRGDSYYLTSTGAMAKDCYVKAKGRNLYYWVDGDGHYCKEWDTMAPDSKYKVII